MNVPFLLAKAERVIYRGLLEREASGNQSLRAYSGPLSRFFALQGKQAAQLVPIYATRQKFSASCRHSTRLVWWR